MPLICSYDSNGMLPGIVYAAPTFYYMDVAYCEQEIKEHWDCVLSREAEEITFPWSYEVAKVWWEREKPWYARG